MSLLPPRVVIAGTHSGVGKTTVATGLMAALASRGVRVGAAKVGPDFIDPGYHALACGRPSRNLDLRLCGEEVVQALAGAAGTGCDLLVIEGVMGLYDGSGSGPQASTAHVARLLDAPVLLVVDAAAMSGSVAALVHGFVTFDPAVRVAGLVLNRVGSDSHEALLRAALQPLGLPVIGVLRRDARLTWRDRHLGLVPVAERPAEVQQALATLAALMTATVDLDAVVVLASSAPTTVAGEVPLPRRWDEPLVIAPGAPGRGGGAAGPITWQGRPPVIALAGGPAFCFTYPELPEALTAAGADVVPFDPRHDVALPARATGLIAGGGFPEVFAAELAANQPLLADVRRRVGGGLPTWAECGGLLWLARSLDGQPLAGVVPADARMTDRLTLGYRSATTRSASPVGPAGTTVSGHELHCSSLDPAGDALDLQGRQGPSRAGHATETLLATYLHVHPAGEPAAVAAFVRSASAPLHA